ncbi:MAG: hypothetical protein L6R39_000028 [Caloplaca ligustica]|nr:MAG: hypothetical protein L6R39_000028 [Caloplaca ligustica]
MYNLTHLKRVKWVAWQAKHVEAIDTIDPRNWNTTKGVPQVYVCVEWEKEGRISSSLETRSTIRRLVGNKSQGGPDYLIFERARRQEEKCFGKRGDTPNRQVSSENRSRKFAFLNDDPPMYESQNGRSRYDAASPGAVEDSGRSSDFTSQPGVWKVRPTISHTRKDARETFANSSKSSRSHGDDLRSFQPPMANKKTQSMKPPKKNRFELLQPDSAIGSDMRSSKKISKSGKAASSVHFDDDVSDGIL